MYTVDSKGYSSLPEKLVIIPGRFFSYNKGVTVDIHLHVHVHARASFNESTYTISGWVYTHTSTKLHVNNAMIIVNLSPHPAFHDLPLPRYKGHLQLSLQHYDGYHRQHDEPPTIGVLIS